MCCVSTAVSSVLVLTSVTFSGSASFAHGDALTGTFVPFSKSNDTENAGRYSGRRCGLGVLEWSCSV